MEHKWEVRKRLEEIENRLYWVGSLSRSDLMGKFGISAQQASADIAQYQSLASGNIVFNRSSKQYEPTETFSPIFVKLSPTDYALWTASVGVPATDIPMPLRTAVLPSLQAISRAIHNKLSLEIEYQSLTTKKRSIRRITPHTIVNDGYRYHVRAYCHLKEDYRDFVLGRIYSAINPDKPGPSKEGDDAWNTLVILRLAPHPGLSTDQQKIIANDYSMDNGELQMRVRQAMLLYTLTQLRLDRFAEQRNPAEQQIVLLNPEVLRYA